MILNDSIYSLIEAVYLKESVTEQASRSNIQVNPRGITNYIVGKVIIINDPEYSGEKIKELIDNGNQVIVRTRHGIPGEIFEPYIIRLEERLMWNGRTYEEGDLENIFYSWDNNSLYFPKIQGLPEQELFDSEGNLSGIAWALHQVGQCMDPSARLQNLDILKTKKVRL